MSTPNSFVQGPIDYGITGSRTWQQLSGVEQDEYLVACFDGEATRAEVERRVKLFDRAAGSLADHLLGIYRQTDVEDGVSHYEPGTPRVAADVLTNRLQALAHTPLGERLRAAVHRREGAAWPNHVAELAFYSVAPAVDGMDILDESCADASGYMAHGEWRGKWNDFSALHRWHDAKSLTARNITGVRTNSNTSAALPPSSGFKHSSPRAPPTPRSFFWVLVGPAAFASVSLLWALYPGNPYTYYVFLRFVVCGTMAFLAINAFAHRWTVFAWLLVAGALLYNPFARVHLDRETWFVVNIATVLFLLATAVLFAARLRRNSKTG